MMKRFLAAALAATFLALPGAALAQEKVTVWWNKGFDPAEDTALNAAIQKWEQQSSMKIELSFFSTEDMVAKTLSAVEPAARPTLRLAGLSILGLARAGSLTASSRTSPTSSIR